MSNLKCMELRRVIIMDIRLKGSIQLPSLPQWHTIILNMCPGQMVRDPYPPTTLFMVHQSTQSILQLDKVRYNMGVSEMRSGIGK